MTLLCRMADWGTYIANVSELNQLHNGGPGHPRDAH
jgi:hypothetical protein